MKVYTAEEAINLAVEFGLDEEVRQEIENGASPNEALAEWDVLPITE